MSRFLRASSPQWIAASIFLLSPRTLAGVAKRRPDGASSSFRSGKPALSSCSKSAMTKYYFWQREHSGKRTTARLDCLGGALSDRPDRTASGPPSATTGFQVSARSGSSGLTAIQQATRGAGRNGA